MSFTQGCSSANIKNINEPRVGNKAVITVYRPYKIEENINKMIVSINDIDVAILKNKQYTEILVPSGSHKISVRYSMGLEASESIKIKPNQNMYLEASGSSGNSVDFVPGSLFFRQRFYIRQSNSINTKNYIEVPVSYN